MVDRLVGTTEFSAEVETAFDLFMDRPHRRRQQGDAGKFGNAHMEPAVALIEHELLDVRVRAQCAELLELGELPLCASLRGEHRRLGLDKGPQSVEIVDFAEVKWFDEGSPLRKYDDEPFSAEVVDRLSHRRTTHLVLFSEGRIRQNRPRAQSCFDDIPLQPGIGPIGH